MKNSARKMTYLAFFLAAWLSSFDASSANQAVEVKQDAATIRLNNGLVSITVDRSDGSLKSIQQCEKHVCHDVGTTEKHAAYEAPGDDFENDYRHAMYWDANADVAHVPQGLTPEPKGYFRPASGRTQVRLLKESKERAEVSVVLPPSPLFPFDIDYRYVLFSGQSGFYAYVVVNHGAEQPAATLYQNRFVIKTVMDGTFTQWAVGNGEFIPIPQAGVSEKLTDATFRLADGTIKTKYMNSVFWSEVPVYGYVGKERGLWMIEASPEYHNGGPTKQGQTLHDNVLLRVLQSVHFGASPVVLGDGEAWNKVYGPFFVYLNHGGSSQTLWDDAQRQYHAQLKQWPYSWVGSAAYSRQRGELSGTVILDDKPAANTWAILTTPDTPWSAQSKGYAFWTKTDAAGHFDLKHVVPGDYALYISGADQPEDLSITHVHVLAKRSQDLGRLEWHPEKLGTRLWQIGSFDRSAGEFRNGKDARQYEMFKRYAEQFPDDVDFTIGQSNSSQDWNYAHWSVFNKHPEWRIHFDVPRTVAGTATLTIGFASAQPAPGRKETDLRVAVNGTEIAAIHLPKTGTAGYRGGVQDSPYNARKIQFDAGLLHSGANVITLKHANAVPFVDFVSPKESTSIPGNATPGQVMYDALRLEISDLQ